MMMSGRLSAGKRSAINNLKLADAAKIARKTQAPELQSQPKRLKEDQELLDLRAQNLHLTAANSALKIGIISRFLNQLFIGTNLVPYRFLLETLTQPQRALPLTNF